MDESVALRIPLKDVNYCRGDITPKNEYTKMNRKKKSIKNVCTNHSTLFDLSPEKNFNETYKEEPAKRIKKSVECTEIQNLHLNEPTKNVDDLRCPEFSPFSQIKYSCSSVRNCEFDNHKVESEQISETQEKSISFSGKCWYIIRYPLTCLISEKIYLSPFVMRFLFYGIIDEKNESVCLRIKDIIKGHLKLHPPCNKKLNDLYNKVLVGDVDNQDLSNPEAVKYNFKNIFTAIQNTLNELANEPEIEPKEEEHDESFTIPENIDGLYKFFSDNVAKTGNILPSSVISANKNLDEKPDKIDSKGIMKRLFMVFSLMVDILEENFRMWWMRFSNRTPNDENSFPIIAEVAWNDTEEWGSLNEHCRDAFKLFKSCPLEYKLEVSRYITLLAEVVRAKEKELKFPFFGSQCKQFAKELSDYIKTENTISQETLSLVHLIYPSWLKLRLCGFLLNSELSSGGVDDLDSILKILQRNLLIRPKPVLNNNDNKRKRISKQSQSKNNKIDHSGETVIHRYCRTNNYKALSIALRNKETNINIADNAGYTPLHHAASYNSIDCLNQLIKYRASNNEEVDIFALNCENDTPLACAVIGRNKKIVDILLRYGAGVSVWNAASTGYSAVHYAEKNGLTDLKNTLVKGWETAISSYKYLNMTPPEIDLIYSMLVSYCKVYHMTERCMELDRESYDSYYKSEHIRTDERTLIIFYEFIEKLCSRRSHQNNLKNFLFYLKRRVK